MQSPFTYTWLHLICMSEMLLLLAQPRCLLHVLSQGHNLVAPLSASKPARSFTLLVQYKNKRCDNSSEDLRQPPAKTRPFTRHFVAGRCLTAKRSRLAVENKPCYSPRTPLYWTSGSGWLCLQIFRSQGLKSRLLHAQ